MRLSEVGAPVPSPDRDDAELCDDNGGADCGRDFLAGLDAEANVPGAVSDHDDGFEARALAGAGLLLHRLDLCDFVVSEEVAGSRGWADIVLAGLGKGPVGGQVEKEVEEIPS